MGWLVLVLVASLFVNIALTAGLVSRRQRASRSVDDGTAAPRSSDLQTTAMVDSIQGHAIFTLDAARNVASWNAAAERMLGYSHSEIVGRPLSIFSVHGDDRRLTERGASNDEGWRVRKDGDHFWGSLSIAPFRHPAGAPGYVVILRDDSARRAAIEALASTSATLEQRTIELGRFNRLAFGRELRMIELKRQVNERSIALGMPAPFDLSFAEGFDDVVKPRRSQS
jgi:PAS domain S-box-containing protein